MNILASYNWLSEYLTHDLTVEEFAKRHTAAGNSVERMHDLRDGLKRIVVGFVDAVEKHPNADKLRIADVNIGTAVVKIVCGGTNLKKKQRVAVALPGARVRWHGEGEPVELVESEIRGVRSHGMICAAVELGFDLLPQGDHEIWDLTKLTKAEPGTPVSEALGLDDFVMDIEVTSNRPDCLGIVGQAREGFAAIGGKFSWKPKALKVEGELPTLSVRVEDAELCPKYEAVLLDGVKVGPSPWWLQKRLMLAGHKPINNVVDVTNYVLLELGHPLHAFDTDKLSGNAVVVRRAKVGEVLKTLDGKEQKLTTDMLVIADAEKPAAVAGVMGGEHSGTSATTTRVILESATFNKVSIRRTARALNLQTDASLSFEKGLSPQATHAALARAVELLKKVAGARVASAPFRFEAKPYQAPVFPFDPKKAAALMGVDMPAKEMAAILKRLGFTLAKNGKEFAVTVPYWRDNDVENSRDFVEEIARIFGYANIASILPVGAPSAAKADMTLAWERRAKEILRGMGFAETYNYSFVSAKELQRYGMDADAAVKIANPLSVEQEYLRPSLIPTMLGVAESNQRRFPQADLFELAPIHRPRGADIPEARLHLLLACVGVDGKEGFLRAKGALERLMRELGVRTWRLERLKSGTDDARWHRNRSAAIWAGEHAHVGMVGQVGADTAKAFGLEQPVFLVELDFEALAPLCSSALTYRALPAFQEVKRDVAFVVADRTEYGPLVAALRAASGLLESVELFDTYRGEGVDEGKKSLAIHLAFRHAERTLTAEEVESELGKLRGVLESQFRATMRA